MKKKHAHTNSPSLWLVFSLRMASAAERRSQLEEEVKKLDADRRESDMRMRNMERDTRSVTRTHKRPDMQFRRVTMPSSRLNTHTDSDGASASSLTSPRGKRLREEREAEEEKDTKKADADEDKDKNDKDDDKEEEDDNEKKPRLSSAVVVKKTAEGKQVIPSRILIIYKQ